MNTYVKVISTLTNEFELEDQINRFIEGKQVINISYQIVNDGGGLIYSALILYKSVWKD